MGIATTPFTTMNTSKFTENIHVPHDVNGSKDNIFSDTDIQYFRNKEYTNVG